MTRKYCSVCWAPFEASGPRGGGNLSRCEKHRRKNCGPLSKRDLRELPAQPVTGIAIPRTCLHCHQPFLARDEAALYCNPGCYADANCHFKVIGRSGR